MKRLFVQLLFVFAILIIWQVLESSINIGRVANGETTLELFFPTPQKIFLSFIQNKELILREMSYTLARAILGLIVGTTFALLVAILLSIFPSLRNLVMPLTLAINSFPVVGFSPLVILAFGQGSWLGIVFISALICYFPTLVTLDYSIQNVERELVELMHLWGANKWQLFTKIQLPYSLPALFASAKLSIPASIIGATLGEWLGTKHGIGHLVTLSFYQLRPSLMYAALLSLTASSLLIVFILNLLEKRAFPWRDTKENWTS